MKTILFLSLLSFGVFTSAYPVDIQQDDYTRKDYSGMDLQGADFSGQYLVNANFTQADLTGADFSNANLIGAKFQYSILTGANFSRANLLYAKFWIYGERWGKVQSWVRSWVMEEDPQKIASRRPGIWVFPADVEGAKFQGAIVLPKLKYFLEHYGIRDEMIVR